MSEKSATRYHIKSVAQMNADKGVEDKHPLITVFDQTDKKSFGTSLFHSDLYMIYLKDSKCADIIYGRKKYDYQEGTMVFIEAGQDFGIKAPTVDFGPPNGWAIAFHPDLLKGSTLEFLIRKFYFFSYDVHEALHLSEQERVLLADMIRLLAFEVEMATVQKDDSLILKHLELILNYAQRFYRRQFGTRLQNESNLVERYNKVLEAYLSDPNLIAVGPPNVTYCAEQLGYSANYLGDLARQKLKISAKEFIDQFLIEKAKERMRKPSYVSLKEIAHSLGFEYQNHFSRYFKKHTQMTPTAFREGLKE